MNLKVRRHIDFDCKSLKSSSTLEYKLLADKAGRQRFFGVDDPFDWAGFRVH